MTGDVIYGAYARSMNITGIDLTAYLVRDPDRAVAFYRDVLGMTPTAIDDQGRGAEFTLPDGSTFGVWKPDDAATDVTIGAAAPLVARLALVDDDRVSLRIGTKRHEAHGRFHYVA